MKDIEFKDLALEWLSLKKLYIKHSTYVKYETIVNHHILPYFISFPCYDINNQNIYHFFEIKRNAQLSNSTLNTIKFILSSIFEYGEENYHIHVMNFKQIKISSTHPTKIVLSNEERDKIIGYVKNHMQPLSVALLLSLYGGLRLGEICALQWKHIDLKNKLVHIEGTATRLKCKELKTNKTEVIIQTPKSYSSCRYVPLPSFVCHYIESYSKTYNHDHYLLSNCEKIYEPRRLEKNFYKFCNETGIHCTFHNLRHSYATECVRQNVEIKTLSEILGHSNVSITLNLYIHTSLEQKQQEIKKLKIPDKFAE